MTRIIFIFILFFIGRGYAQEDIYLSLSTIKARPIAMGGAYTSVEDNITSAGYNPASLDLYQNEKNFRITFFLNPIAPSTKIYDHYFRENAENGITSNLLKYAASFIKGFVITAKFIDLGFIFGEQIIDQNSLIAQKEVFKDYDLWNNCYHTIVARIKLAERVSLGGSASLFRKKVGEKVEHDYGFSYGILIKPKSHLNIGMAYHYLPQLMPEVRMPLEKLVDHTINVGISYYPTKSTTFTVDVRNLTEEKDESAIEAHFGFEQRIFSLVAIQAGYYKERFSPNQTISVGLGIIDTNIFFSKNLWFKKSPFLINYALAYHKTANQIFRWHVISLTIRI